MSSWSSTASYAYGPIMALIGIVTLVLLLRWAFGRGQSVVEQPPRPGAPRDYGLLEPVASPETYIEGEMVRRSLADAGLRVTLAQTNDGPRVMVWPEDAERARALLNH